MYRLKQVPEDFIVKEIDGVAIQKKGAYHYCRLTKKNRNTLDVVKEIARQLHVREKDIGFAGTKDRHALTTQLISLRGVLKGKISSIRIDNASLEHVGYGDVPLSLGDLRGNDFEITIRNLDDTYIKKIYAQIKTVRFIPNYFDEQRFSKNNVAIGKCIITKEFGKAAALIGNEKINNYLSKNKNDHVGALRLLPARLLRMYVNAYQSFLWNTMLASYLKRYGTFIQEVTYSQGVFVFTKEIFPQLEVPLIGFSTPEVADGTLQMIIKKVVQKEAIAGDDFIIKQIPELSLEGELRKAFVEVKGLKVARIENDELNKGKKKIKVHFSLPKGSYATIVIKRIFS